MRKKRSLSTQALGLLCLAITMPVLLSLVYFFTTISEKLEQTAQESAEFYLSQLSETTENAMEFLRSISYTVIADRTVQAEMSASGAPSQYVENQIVERFNRSILFTSAKQKSFLSSVLLVKNDGSAFRVLEQNYFSRSAARIAAVLQEYPHQNSTRELVISAAAPGYAYAIMDYCDLYTLEVLGKLVFETDIRQLSAERDLSDLYPSSAVFLSSRSGQVLCELQGGRSGGTDAGESFAALTQQADPRSFHTRQRIGDTELLLDAYIPSAEIFAGATKTVGLYVGFSILVLLVTMLLGVGLYSLLVQPLGDMASAIDQMAGGNLSVRMVESPYRETDRIVHAFNDMADRLGDLFNEVYEKGLLLQESEAQMLESQISPHFIFNVLETINLRLLEANQPELSHMVTNLARMLRTNVRHKHRQRILLRDELLYVRYYLELQKERFGEQLCYEIEYDDEDTLNCYIPKLVIQPLVENSVVHGIEPKRGGGSLRVSIWEEESGICVRVTDDGLGFDCPEFLGQPDRKPDGLHTHVALWNIARRIQLLCGSPYGMTIRSAPGAGTDILLTLPAQTQEEPKPTSGGDVHV